MMISSLMQSMGSLFWAIVVFGIIFYIFGVVFTVAVTDYCRLDGRWKTEESQNLRDWFGTLDRSAVSLFMGISGGADWGDFYLELEVLSPLMQMLFILYVWFCLIAVINVVTGIFVEGAIKCAANDRETLIEEELREKDVISQQLLKLFNELSADNDEVGTVGISKRMFEEHMKDERAQAYINALDIDFDDVETLFELLDEDGSGSVDIKEFLQGCERLKGQATSIDMAMLHHEVRFVRGLLLEARGRASVRATTRAQVASNN